MKLSDAQKEAIVAAHRELMAKLSRIYSEYQTLLGSLAAGASTAAESSVERAPPTVVRTAPLSAF